ncbi:hypothetical protein [Ferruginibacter sp.]|nr:hypothetical protein [Ferruginibacter sp.]
MFIFILIGCQKTDSGFENSVPITSQSTHNQIDFANKQLKQITEGIALLAKNKDFVSFVHTEAKKKFDGEYEVLIQNLQKNTNWKEALNTLQINSGLNAFKNIEGSNFYPQIYIPKFQHEEDMKEEKNYTAPTNVAADSIVYIYYAGDSEVDSATNENESYAGYVLNGSNQLEYWGMVNEEYANENEVWIISLNESVGNNGNFCPPQLIDGVYQYCPEAISGVCCGGGGGNDDPPPPPPTGCTGPDCDPTMDAPFTVPFPDLGHAKVNCKLERMIIKDAKESWLAGASEISIRAKLHTHNNRALGNFYPAAEENYTSLQKSNYLGKLIKKVKRKQIRRGDDMVVNYALETNWQAQYLYSDPIFFDFVIFEKDNWPAGLNRYKPNGRIDQRAGPSVETLPWDLFYRSADHANEGRNTPYYTASIVNNWDYRSFGLYYNGAVVNGSQISFKILGY